VSCRLIAVILCVFLAVSARAEVTAAAVQQKVDELVGQIKGTQQPNGSWPHGQTAGFTALNLLALATAGVPEADPTVGLALAYLKDKFPSRNAYAVGLYACAFAAVNPTAYREQIERAAAWLIARQRSGTWNYTGTGRGDNSVTQFAMLGIKAALDCGVDVPDGVLEATAAHFAGSQRPDGAWGYQPKLEGRASMIPAGLSSLAICGVPMEHSLELEQGPAFLGKYRSEPVVTRGIKAMVGNMDFASAYTAYGIERVGIFYDQQRFGGVDWYRRGCAEILRGQRRGFGGCDVQFNLLFLAKGNRPLLFTKVQWGKGADWNHRHNDVRSIVRYLSVQFQQSLDWRVSRLGAGVQHLAKTPLLYISGYERLDVGKQELEALRGFVDNGGTVVFAPNQISPAFIRSISTALRKLYPGCQFRPLPAFHPLRGMYFDLYGQKLPLRVWRTGCTTKSIFVFTEDTSLEFEKPQADAISRRLTANLARFALKERPLISRLDHAALRAPKEHEEGLAGAGGVREGAFRIAQLQYAGEWDPDVTAMDNFLGYLRQGLSMPTGRERVVVAADDALHMHPVLYVTGHSAINLSPRQKLNLREYLRRGGVLVADACCSRDEFDEAFNQLLQELLPEHKLERIPTSSPVYHEPFVLEPEPNRALAELLENDGADYLRGVRIEERYAVIYSRWDFGCAMDGHLEPDIPGFDATFAYQLMANIVSYALTY
jgi:hypothetical protein